MWSNAAGMDVDHENIIISAEQIFSFLSDLRGYFQNYHKSSQTHITAFFVHWGSYVTSPT